MTEFLIGIAGRRIRVHAMYEYAKEYCQNYLTEGEPDFTVVITPADIDFERLKSAREDEVEGLPIHNYKDDYLETLAIYRKIVERMLDYDAFLFHGSAICVDGKGYLFTAKSGTGKSTHSRIWARMFEKRCVVVNDDKPLILVTEDGVMVCGTPWDGKHRRSNNLIVPLTNLVILERGEENSIEPISAAAALPLLLQQSYRPSNPFAMGKMLNLLDKTIHRTNLYQMKCTISAEAVLVAYEGMNRKG